MSCQHEELSSTTSASLLGNPAWSTHQMNFVSSECVFPYVRSQTADHDVELRHLRADYRGTFQEWVLQVGRLQTVSQLGHVLAIKEAEGRVALAEIAYRQTRNRLAEEYSRWPEASHLHTRGNGNYI